MALFAEEHFEFRLHGFGPNLVARFTWVESVRHDFLGEDAILGEEGRCHVEVVD